MEMLPGIGHSTRSGLSLSMTTVNVCQGYAPENEQDLFNRKLNRPACRVFSARSKLPFVSYSKKFCVRKSSITSARDSRVQAQKIVLRHKCIMLFQRMLTYFFIALAL
ncbi:uncharacterized protein LOC112464226 [Temnothorax curvispinosus]|uniref:Uncharacterized protein LOC112464226 n=1 Tax=Temnothorax curvispinosus TaxID=300111 RepID=A0A6J1QW47_9HYME|nr:uncharacterized protein LOC112464226 [Temnothorax curvispinosus]